jgi:hypothetical protein
MRRRGRGRFQALALALALVLSTACSGLTDEPGVTRDALADTVIRLTRERPSADLTITLRADSGALRDRSAATAYLRIQPSGDAQVEVDLGHSAKGLPPPDSSGLDEAGELSFSAFTTCPTRACEEPWDVTITWKEPRDAAFLSVGVGVIVSVRYGQEADPPPDDQIGVTIE